MRFVQAKWDKDAREELARVYEHDGLGFMLDVLEDEVNDGTATLFEAFGTLNIIKGYVVTRVEEIPGYGKELVIVAAAMKEKDSVSSFLPWFERYGEQLGCESVRMHSTKHGMWRMFEREGYNLQERVYTKVI